MIVNLKWTLSIVRLPCCLSLVNSFPLALADNLFSSSLYMIRKKETINQKLPYFLSNKCTNLPTPMLILFFPCLNIRN